MLLATLRWSLLRSFLRPARAPNSLPVCSTTAGSCSNFSHGAPCEAGDFGAYRPAPVRAERRWNRSSRHGMLGGSTKGGTVNTEHGSSEAPVTGATHGSTERASRWLAESTLSFDLGDEVRQLLEEEGWRKTGHTAKTLVKEADLRVVLVALRHGAAMDPHQSSG